MSEEKSIFSNPDTFHEALGKIKNEIVSQPEQETIPNDIKAAEEQQEAILEQSEVEPQGDDQSGQERAEKPEKSHLIPKSRFNEVVNKQKATEEELQRMRDDKVRLETQLQMFAEMQKAQQQQYQQNEPEIDPLDTETYNYAKNEINSLRAEVKKMSEQMAHNQRQTQMYNNAGAQANDFSKNHPDFKEAFDHVHKVELAIAKRLIPDARQAEALVEQKLQDTIAISLNNGYNAAETMYEIAKEYGFTPNGQKKSQPSGANLDAINRNMNNSRSLADVGNSANLSNPVPTDIIQALNKDGNMTSGINEDKFYAMLKKLS